MVSINMSTTDAIGDDNKQYQHENILTRRYTNGQRNSSSEPLHRKKLVWKKSNEVTVIPIDGSAGMRKKTNGTSRNHELPITHCCSIHNIYME
jgi:hypothetical protein